MDLLPGHYWKTPFLWEPGCPEPRSTRALRFEPATHEALLVAVGQVMASSSDPSDRHAVAQHGERGAAEDLLSFAPEYFTWSAEWWRFARNDESEEVGFVLPVVFKDEQRSRGGRPQGTVFYMGVLPEHRGKGYSFELLVEATRLFIAAGCWRIFCDTGTDNAPMVRSFRKAGYIEREPWQRPVA
jgi:ribosomal protein S18 acetylase RimI-like enzyme